MTTNQIIDEKVSGFVAPGYERVLETFRKNFDDHKEVGAACCVHVGGRIMVDLWGGLANPATGKPWEADTPVPIFSSTKGITAICVHRLVQTGTLDLDAPVVKYWPEFAAEGKASVLLRWVLSHRAGVPAVDQHFTLEDVLDWSAVVAAVAAQKLEWEPGTRHGYHARTYGWILGEVVRRVTGKSLGRFFSDEIAGPLGLDCWIGLPEEIESKVASIVPPERSTNPAVRAAVARLMGPTTLLGRTITKPDNLFAYDERWNTRPYHAAELPSTNGIGTARALSRMYAATIGEIDGIRLLEPSTVGAACLEQSAGTDAVLGSPTRYGVGFSLFGPEGSFGSPGAGGSLGFADTTNRLAFGYVMNRMHLTDNSRATALAQSVYQSL